MTRYIAIIWLLMAMEKWLECKYCQYRFVNSFLECFTLLIYISISLKYPPSDRCHKCTILNSDLEVVHKLKYFIIVFTSWFLFQYYGFLSFDFKTCLSCSTEMSQMSAHFLLML